MTGAAVACLMLCVAPLAASARPGDGIKMGPGRLKLGVEMETRYDSQAGTGVYTTSQNPGDLLWVSRAVLQLDAKGQTTTVNLAGGLDWNQYLGLVARGTRGLSFLGANLAGGVHVNPAGRVGLDLTTSLQRSDRVTNPVFGLGVLGLTNENKARVRFRPGGGAIELGASYQFSADIYARQALPGDPSAPSGLCSTDPSCNPDLAAAYNTLGHRVGVDAKWRFLPKTGLTLEADYGRNDYTWGTEFLDGNTGARPIRALAGFGTLLTTRLSFAVRGGYQGMMFAGDRLPMVHSWLGQAELGYRLTETFQLRGGFDRSFTPVGGDQVYFVDNRGYGELKAQFSRLVLTARASVDLIGYGNGSTRSDLAFSGQVRADLHATNWLRFMLGAGASTRGVSGVAQPADSAYDYARWELIAGLGTLF